MVIAAGVLLMTIASSASGPQVPHLLSETGLYVAGDLEVSSTASGGPAIDPRNRPYSPQYPLWTDGAQKTRWVYLPEGATIDVRNVDAWDFPAGTRFWKEFAFGGRKVETRMLWKAGEGASDWVFAVYVWNDAQTDAVLGPEDGVPHAVEVAPGKRHSIPAVADCRACHDGTRTEILGFTALQLSTDRDPHVPHGEPLTEEMVTLKTLVAEKALRPLRAELVTSPPRIAAEHPATRTVLGYLSANCGHCHNAQSSVANGALRLLQPSSGASMSDAAVATALQRQTSWQIPGNAEGGTVLVRPGAPELSALLHRMRSRRPSSQMPPLGSVVQDREAVELVEKWIEALP